MSKRLFVILLISLFFRLSTPYSASFPYYGVVNDIDGNGISNATVKLKSSGETTLTDSNGGFGTIITAVIPNTNINSKLSLRKTTLSILNYTPETFFSITLTDFSGRTIVRKSFISNKFGNGNISLISTTRSISNGMYIIQIKSSSGSFIFKSMIISNKFYNYTLGGKKSQATISKRQFRVTDSLLVSCSEYTSEATSVSLNTTKYVITLLDQYPTHKNITSSTFWCGEGASSANEFITNTQSAWDVTWGSNFGIEDNPLLSRDSDYIPTSSSYKKIENPYYFALPYDDFGSLVYDGVGNFIDNAPTDGIGRKTSSSKIYWADTKSWSASESMVKNRWIKINVSGTSKYCYAQWEDAGPYYYNDYNYVFGSSSPLNTTDSPYAGVDLSPSVSLYLGRTMETWGTPEFSVDWKFIEESDVPNGPWKTYVTTSQINW